MRISKHIKEKKFAWGGVALAAPFPAGGLVYVVGSIASGSRSTADDELANLHAQMLLEGTTRKSKRQLQERLDELGASLSFSAASDRLVWRAQVRRPHLRALMALIAEVLQHPAFPKEELAILKKREESNLALQAQDTRAQAEIALSRMLYKKDHPNFSQTTAQSIAAVKKVSVEHLRAYHMQTINRATLVCAVAGNIPAAQAHALVEKYFSTLPAKKPRPSAVPATPPPAATRKATPIAQKASIDYVAGIAARIPNTHTDYPALVLGLQILGNRGGFTGRLMNIVREKEGLTYGVYSYPCGFAHDTDGQLQAWATFAPQLFAKGRAAILREIRRIVDEGAGEEETRKHGKLFEARARVGRSSAGALARAAHDTVVDRKPLSHLDAFPKRVASLTAKEVNRVLKKYLRPDKLAESAAGPLEKF